MDTTKVTAGKPKTGGAIYCAPVGTELPKDVTSELNELFQNLGYASEEGVINANGPTTDKQKAWGGDTVLNYQIDKPDRFRFTLIEALNINVLKAVYGDENVTGDLANGITIKANSKDAVPHAWIIDMILKDAVKRVVIPNASAVEIAEINYVDNKSISYGITISAVPDKEGNTHYEYIKATAGENAEGGNAE